MLVQVDTVYHGAKRIRPTSIASMKSRVGSGSAEPREQGFVYWTHWGYLLWLWNKPDERECIRLGNCPPERLYPHPQPLLPLIHYEYGTNFKRFQVIVARMLPELTCGSRYAVIRLHLEMKMLWQTARVFLALSGNSSFSPCWPDLHSHRIPSPLPMVSRTVSTR